MGSQPQTPSHSSPVCREQWWKSSLVGWTSTISLKFPLWLQGQLHNTRNNPSLSGMRIPESEDSDQYFPQQPRPWQGQRTERWCVQSYVHWSQSLCPSPINECLQQSPEHTGIGITWKGEQATVSLWASPAALQLWDLNPEAKVSGSEPRFWWMNQQNELAVTQYFSGQPSC